MWNIYGHVWLEQTCTILHWEGNEKFYNYVQWLQFVVDYIIGENQALAPPLDFQGAITWNHNRTDCDDKGVLTLKVCTSSTMPRCCVCVVSCACVCVLMIDWLIK